jgi:adenylate cyclase
MAFLIERAMTIEDFKRKLTAILSADVVGYSRLMSEDDGATVRTLTGYREVMSTLVKQHQGRVVDSPGDNLLAEFESVLQGVNCAVEIQRELAERNAELPEDRRMEYRIGVNLGDVIKEGDRIYGDGVNIAARLESVADPGGICISGIVYSQVKNRLKLEYEYLGKRTVKNISEPVPVYRVLSVPKAAIRPGVKEEEAYSLSDKPSIVVLPFVNISGDPEQEYFSDGMTEELISVLAKLEGLKVISRTSAFYFKGEHADLRTIGERLNVKNVLEGSVRKAGNKLRITAQLIKVADDTHLWSKTYDKELKVKEIFAVQENIATSVADELKVTLGLGKSFRELGGTDNLEAYELYLVAKGLISDFPGLETSTEDTYAKINRALKSLDAAIALDPEFASAWATKAVFHWSRLISMPANRVASDMDSSLNAALRAIELEPNLAEGYYSLGLSRFVRGDFIEAELAYRKGMELASAPINTTYFGLPVHSRAVGYFEKAQEFTKADLQIDPLSQVTRGGYIFNLGLLGDTQRAEEEYDHGRALFSDHWSWGDYFLAILRLCTKDVVSRDEIVYSNLIFDTAKEYLDSPNEGLAKLHRLYRDENNLGEKDITDISILAAYFGDPEFAMDAMEKGLRINAAGVFKIWPPVMHEVRQLPRFKEFVREIGLVDYWKEFGWPDLCRPVGDDDFECD